MALLSVDNLTVTYSRDGRSIRAVDAVSFTVAEGETLALVGESGCGKTTAALAVLRLLPPSARVQAKSIRLSDTELSTASESALRAIRGKDVGMIFQEPAAALNPLIIVGEQVAEAVRVHENVSRRQAWERAIEAMADAGIPDPSRRAREYPHQLSGGLKQRAMIAAALVCRPRLLIADEPTTALDVSLQAQIIDLLLKLREERRLALLLITHDLGVVAELAQRVAVLYAGQVVEQATVGDLFARPRHPYTQALLAAVPGTASAPPPPKPHGRGSVGHVSNVPLPILDQQHTSGASGTLETCPTDSRPRGASSDQITSAAQSAQVTTTPAPPIAPVRARLAALEGTVPDLARLPVGCRFAPRCRQAADECGKPQELQALGSGVVRCCRAGEASL
jgi:oligopeptide/dipeptide ABC transporter ATP-binding protein